MRLKPGSTLRSSISTATPRASVCSRCPPDFTRMHSMSGLLTELAHNFYGERLVDVLPALGTHKPMSDVEIGTMFGVTPRRLFRVHDWRNDIVTLGEVPGEFMHEVS